MTYEKKFKLGNLEFIYIGMGFVIMDTLVSIRHDQDKKVYVSFNLDAGNFFTTYTHNGLRQNTWIPSTRCENPYGFRDNVERLTLYYFDLFILGLCK